MKLKSKWYLWFTIIYWFLIIVGVILFGFAFEKVPINSYGMRRNYFDSTIEQQYYPAGLYHKDVGYYFIHFPASKKYVEDIELNVTNKDMQTIGIKYTLVYRIFPEKIYTLYSQLSQQYQARIIAIVNSIVSNHFTNIQQKNTRVSVQSDIIDELQSQFGDKIPILKECIQIQAFWLNQMDFYEGQKDYSTAYKDANSYSEAYQKIQIQLQKMNLKVETLKNLIVTTRNKLSMETKRSIVTGINQVIKQSERTIAQKKVKLSKLANISQIFQYYRSPKLIFN